MRATNFCLVVCLAILGNVVVMGHRHHGDMGPPPPPPSPPMPHRLTAAQLTATLNSCTKDFDDFCGSSTGSEFVHCVATSMSNFTVPCQIVLGMMPPVAVTPNMAAAEFIAGCGSDVNTLCSSESVFSTNTSPGDMISCLTQNKDSVSSACKNALVYMVNAQQQGCTHGHHGHHGRRGGHHGGHGGPHHFGRQNEDVESSTDSTAPTSVTADNVLDSSALDDLTSKHGKHWWFEQHPHSFGYGDMGMGMPPHGPRPFFGAFLGAVAAVLAIALTACMVRCCRRRCAKRRERRRVVRNGFLSLSQNENGDIENIPTGVPVSHT